MSLKTVAQQIELASNAKIYYLSKENKKNSKGIKIKKVEFLDCCDDVRKKTKTSVLNYINDIILKNRLEVSFSIDDVDSKKHYYSLSVDKISNFEKIIRTIKANDTKKLQTKNIMELNPNLYIIEFSYQGQTYYLFKNYNPVTLVKNTVFLGIDITNAESAAISIKNSLDCLYDSNTKNMYIFIKSNFESIFDYKDDYENYAQKVLKEIKDANFIANLDEFAEYCLNKEKHFKFLAKIYTEKKLKTVLQYKKSLNKIIADYKLNIELTNGAVLFKPELKTGEKESHVQDILELLDYAFWKNALTGEPLRKSVTQNEQQSFVFTY